MTDSPQALPAIEVWRRCEPSFRGAVIAQMQEQMTREAGSLQNIMAHGSRDDDVMALAERMGCLLDARAAAIKILQEAAR